MIPSGAPALERCSYSDHSSRLRACRHCNRELPAMCTVFMALDSPFCSQQCRTTFVFSHVDVVAAHGPPQTGTSPPPQFDMSSGLLEQQQSMSGAAA